MGSWAFGVGVFGLNWMMLPGIFSVFIGLKVRLLFRKSADLVEHGLLDEWILTEEDYSVQLMGKERLQKSLLKA